MSGSSGGPSGGGIKGKDGMTRGGTKNGRVFVKTERAGSDAKPKVNLPTKANPLAERGSSSPAAKSEVARGSSGASNSSGTEVGRSGPTIKSGSPAEGMKDVGSSRTQQAQWDRDHSKAHRGVATTDPAPKAGFGSVLGRLLGRAAGPLGAAAAVMSPSSTNDGEAEWLAKNKGQNASMGVTSPTPAPAKKAPASPSKAAAPVKKSSVPPSKAPASKASGLSADDKISQLVAKGFSRADATKLAGAQSAKVSSPAKYEKEQGFAKGGMPKKPKVPGMPRMPKMPATGKEAMASKMAAMTKPKKIK